MSRTILILFVIGAILLIVLLICWNSDEAFGIESFSSVDDAFIKMALTTAPGTGVIDAFPFLDTGKYPYVDWYPNGAKTWPGRNIKLNGDFTSPYYATLMNADLANRPIVLKKDKERSKLLAYLLAVYYHINLHNLKKLTTDELTGLYRSLVFYYITTPETQPDGGWYGDYWIDRIQDYGPSHDKNSGQTNMTALRNESFFFDSLMTHSLPVECPGYRLDYNGMCPEHSKYFGNRIFAEMCQSTLRRGMRNSPQVLREFPPWASNGEPNSRYGLGGFPADSFVELLQFPQEHGMQGWPSGCNAHKADCDLKEGFFSQPRYQPEGNSRKAGGDPYCGLKPQWFYFAQGLGQFWNMGQTSYCYSYVDLFLNGPMGTGFNASSSGELNPVGWGDGFSPCSDRTPFPPGGGALGYDINDPSHATEHDYNDPVYSMKLLLEFASRTDIPGACGDDAGCHPGLRDPRTGMMGIGFCAKGGFDNDADNCPEYSGKCPCYKETGNNLVNCLNQEGPDMGDPVCSNTGCGPSQPINSLSTAFNEQVAALMNLKRGYYWKPYGVSGESASNYAKGIKGTLNQYGGFDPTEAWAKVRMKNCPLSNYPKRYTSDYNSGSYLIKDNRYLVTGWVNGHFYGYPKGQYLGSYESNGYNPFRGGIPGTDPQTGEIIYGKHCTYYDPLIYYDMYGKEIYRTWFGKALDMDEDTAIKLMAEFYSCGDTGFDSKDTNWPFGCYFGYGQALGSPGKSATNKMSCVPYGCTTVQFTSTPTSYSSVVQPAYDFEVLYIPPVNSDDNATDCTCATAVTLDITADFNSHNAGSDLKRYLCLNKGSTGGYVPRTSPAGKTATAFKGNHMGVTNFTNVYSTSSGDFDPYEKNPYGVDSNPLFK